MSQKLRISYSLLNLWTSGRHEEAIALYLHKPIPKTKAMLYGVEFHKKLEEAIIARKKIKLGSTEFTFSSPEPEKKLIVSFNDQWDLSGTIDCIDVPNIYEFKSGVISSVDYANGYQVPFYFLMCNLAEIKVDKAFIIHYNQNKKIADWIMLWNGKEQQDKAKNYIESIAPEIENYFLENNIPLSKD